MSARTSLKAWEYRKIDEVLLCMGLSVPFSDTNVADTDRIMGVETDSEVIVNVKSSICVNCNEVFSTAVQLKKHEKKCLLEKGDMKGNAIGIDKKMKEKGKAEKTDGKGLDKARTRNLTPSKIKVEIRSPSTRKSAERPSSPKNVTKTRSRSLTPLSPKAKKCNITSPERNVKHGNRKNDPSPNKKKLKNINVKGKLVAESDKGTEGQMSSASKMTTTGERSIIKGRSGGKICSEKNIVFPSVSPKNAATHLKSPSLMKSADTKTLKNDGVSVRSPNQAKNDGTNEGSDKQIFSCGLCSRTFNTRMGYKQHFRKTHINDSDNDTSQQLNTTDHTDTSPMQSPASSAMSKRGLKETTSPDREEKKHCKVCGDFARKLHLSKVLCEACWGFFKKQRHVPEILRKCLRNKDCVIDLVSRNSCQYCRYHKILQLVDVSDGRSKEEEEKTVCDICDEVIEKKKDLFKHMAHHYGISAEFYKKKGKERTERAIYNRMENGFQIQETVDEGIEIAGKTEESSSEFFRKYVKKSFKCELCPKFFNSLYCCNIHFKMSHKNSGLVFEELMKSSKPIISCVLCNKNYGWKFPTAKHYLKHHKDALSETTSGSNRRESNTSLVIGSSNRSESAVKHTKSFKQKNVVLGSGLSNRKKKAKKIPLRVKFFTIKKNGKKNGKKVKNKNSSIDQRKAVSKYSMKNETTSQNNSEQKLYTSSDITIKQECRKMESVVNIELQKRSNSYTSHTEIEGCSSVTNTENNSSQKDTGQYEDDLNSMVMNDVSSQVEHECSTHSVELHSTVKSTVEDTSESEQVPLVISCKDKLHERLMLSFDQREPKTKQAHRDKAGKKSSYDFSGLTITLQCSSQSRMIKDTSRQDTSMTKSDSANKVPQFTNVKITLGSDSHRSVMGTSENDDSCRNTSSVEHIVPSFNQDKEKNLEVGSDKIFVEYNSSKSSDFVRKKIVESESESLGNLREESKNKDEVSTCSTSLEVHVMEPLGSQPSDVEPVKILSKSCVSINSPKDLTLKSGTKRSHNGKAGPKSSKISRESLTKRFERSHSLGNEKDSDKHTSELSEGNEELNNDMADKHGVKQHVIKDTRKSGRLSPKVFLHRLPEMLIIRKSVNIKDLSHLERQGETNYVGKNCVDFTSNTSLIGDVASSPLVSSPMEGGAVSTPVHSLIEDGNELTFDEVDEEQAAVIAQNVADLSKVVMQVRKTRSRSRSGGNKNIEVGNKTTIETENKLTSDVYIDEGFVKSSLSDDYCAHEKDDIKNNSIDDEMLTSLSQENYSSDLESNERMGECIEMDKSEHIKPSEKENFMRQIELSGESSDDLCKTTKKIELLPCFSPLTVELSDDGKTKTKRGRSKLHSSEKDNRLVSKGSPSKSKEESSCKERRSRRKTRSSCINEESEKSDKVRTTENVVVSGNGNLHQMHFESSQEDNDDELIDNTTDAQTSDEAESKQSRAIHEKLTGKKKNELEGADNQGKNGKIKQSGKKKMESKTELSKNMQLSDSSNFDQSLEGSFPNDGLSKRIEIGKVADTLSESELLSGNDDGENYVYTETDYSQVHVDQSDTNEEKDYDAIVTGTMVTDEEEGGGGIVESEPTLTSTPSVTAGVKSDFGTAEVSTDVMEDSDDKMNNLMAGSPRKGAEPVYQNLFGAGNIDIEEVEMQDDENRDVMNTSGVSEKSKCIKAVKENVKSRKHFLKSLPSREKEKKSLSLSRKQSRKVMNSYMDLLLDGNRSAMPNIKIIDMEKYQTTSCDNDSNPRADDRRTPLKISNQTRLISQGFDEPDSSQPESVDSADDGESQGFDLDAACLLNSTDLVTGTDKQGFDLDVPCTVKSRDLVDEGFELDAACTLTADDKDQNSDVKDIKNFKILRLNVNPCFSDEKSKNEVEKLQEQLSPIYPKIVRYGSDFKSRENGNRFSLDDCLLAVLKLRNKNGKNGSHCKDIEVDKVLKDSQVKRLSDDCFEVEISHMTKQHYHNIHELRQLFVKEHLTDEYVCGQCDEMFTSRVLYLEHQQKGDCVDFLDVIDYSVDSPFNHMAVDLNLQPEQYLSKKFVCDYCGLRYKWEKNLSQHLRTHHLKEQAEKLNTSELKSDTTKIKERQGKVSELKIMIKKLSKTLDSGEKTWTVSPPCEIKDKPNISSIDSENRSSMECTESSKQEYDANNSCTFPPDRSVNGNVIRYIAEPISVSPCRGILSEDVETLINSSMGSDIQTSTTINSSMVSDDRVSSSGIQEGSTMIDNTHIEEDQDMNHCYSADEEFEDEKADYNSDEKEVHSCNDIANHSNDDGQKNYENGDLLKSFSCDEQGQDTRVCEKVEDQSNGVEERSVIDTQITSESDFHSQNDEQNLYHEKINSDETNAPSSSPVMTFSEIRERYPGIFEACSVSLTPLSLEDKLISVGGLKLKQLDSQRWRIKSENVNTQVESNTKSLFAGSFSLGNSMFANESANISSQGSEMDTFEQGRRGEKTSKLVIPGSPRKNLTEFEKAISEPKEVKKKKKVLDRIPSKDESNSQDGLDFLKKVNERVCAKSQSDSFLIGSKLAQSIINKKTKEQQESLSIASYPIEEIEPFETVLALKDKVKKSPVKKKMKLDSRKSCEKKISAIHRLNSTDLDLNIHSFCDDQHDRFQGNIQKSLQRITVRKDSDASSLSTSEIQSVFSQESEKSKSKEKQKSLSDRFGAISKLDCGKSPNSISYKGMKSDEVMKSMFGPMNTRFDKKFRKQPGMEEESNATISRKSPLDSVNKNVDMTYKTSSLKDIKQTVFIASEQKPKVGSKNHLLNMLKAMMDTPVETTSDGNLSLSSPKGTGIFSDTRSYKRVVIEEKQDHSVKKIPESRSREAKESNLVHRDSNFKLFESSSESFTAGLPNLGFSKMNTSQKSNASETASFVSNESSEKVKKSVTSGNNENLDTSDTKKSNISNLKSTTVTDTDSELAVSDSMSVSSKHSGYSDCSFRKKRVSESSDTSSSRKRIKLSRLPVGIAEPLEHLENSMSTVENVGVKNCDGHQPRLDDELDLYTHRPIQDQFEATKSKTDLTVNRTDTEDVKLRSVKSTEDRSSENLMLKLELETKCNENESSINISKEGIGNLKDIDDNLSPVSSGDFHNSFGEQVESGNFINSPREEKEDSNSCESDMECQEESKAITDEDESNNGNNDDNDSDNDSGSENSSEEDGEVNDSGDGNVCNQDNQEEELDIFSTRKNNVTNDYHDDDAISIIVDEYETASFLIAPANEEAERMDAVDRELDELNKEDSNSSKESFVSRQSDMKRLLSQEKFAVPMTPKLLIYPQGYCFSYLRSKVCQNGKKCTYKHQPPSNEDMIWACVKAIETAFKKNDVNKAFEVYKYLLELKLQTNVGPTSRETLGQLLKVAENNWKVDLAFSLLDEMNSQNMINEEICNAYVRLSGQNPAKYSKNLWKLFEMTQKYQRNLFTPDSITVLIRSFLNLHDMSYLWQVILYAKHVHLRCVPAALQYQVMDRSLHNTDTYYPYIEKWVLMCEPYLLQRMDAKMRNLLLHLFRVRGQSQCFAMIEDSCTYANIQQQLDESYEASSSAIIQEADVVLKDCIKTTDNYKALYHKIQSCYHTKNWSLLGETFVELCQQGELDNSYYIDAYSVVFLTNVKNSSLLVEAFDQFMLSLSQQYQLEAQEDVLACYDYRSLSFIGNRLLYACQDKHWWIEGHSIILILLKYSVPFYRYTEAGKPLSCITAINISLQANSIDTAYSTLLHFDWEKQPKLTIQQLQIEITVLHDLFEQLQINAKPREALKVLGSCFDIIENNPEMKDYFDFIEDLNRLLLTALELGDIHCGCWAFKLHSSAGLLIDLDRRTLRALLTACGENSYLTEAKELYKICKSKASYPIQSVEAPRTIHLNTAMTYVEIKLEIESYLEWVYRYLCELQMDGNMLDTSNFYLRVHIEWVNDPVAYKMPYLCRVPRTEMAAYSMVQNLLMAEFGMEGTIDDCQGYTYVYVLSEHVKTYFEKLDAQGLRQGFRIRGFRPSIK